MFRIEFDEGGDTPLCYAVSAEGLFADVDDPEPTKITFVGLSGVAADLDAQIAHRRPGLLDVDVLSSTGRMLGHYNLDPTVIHRDDNGAAPPSLTLEQAQPISLPGGHSLWQRWVDESKPLEHGEWLSLSADHRASWLDIARSVWGVNGYAERVSPSRGITSVDGRLVTDETSLYLTLGEALVGPGGYVGWGLDALDDCLSSLVRGPISMRWDLFARASEALGDKYLAEVLEVLAEHEVTVTTVD